MKEKILSCIERIPESGCWIWTRCIGPNGYGQFKSQQKLYSAHRASYEAFVGPIPDGLHVLHSCDVRACVNPSHLSVGTNLDNIKDSERKGRRYRLGKLGNGRAAEISARLAAGGTIAGLAREYGLNPITIRRLKRKAA